MKCEEAQQLILLEDLESSALQSHVQDCEICKEFKSSLGIMMKDEKTLEVPKSLDGSILKFARENRPEVEKESKPVIPFVFMAFAAAVAILLAVSLLSRSSVNSQGAQETVEKQDVVNPIKEDKQRVMVAANSDEAQKIDDVLNNLWSDDSIDADLVAVESELFVLNAELYMN